MGGGELAPVRAFPLRRGQLLQFGNGGLTEELLYDNPRTVVLQRAREGQRIQWQPHG
jgi:hypothetical protein